MTIINKTIFDYCKDRKIINEIIGGDYSESYYKEFPPIAIAEHLMQYAARINDASLFKAAQAYREKAQTDFDNAFENAQKQGYIID